MQPESVDPVSALMKLHKEALRFPAPPTAAWAPVREPRRGWLMLAAGAAAAAACVAISVLSFQLGRYSERSTGEGAVAGEVVSGHVRSLMAGHLSDVVSTDRHTVKPWFEGKLDFGPAVQDYGDKGFALVGGRLDYVGGRAVAALVYRHDRHFVNVFEWPATGGGNSAPRLSTERGFQLFTWQKNGLVFWLVSDVNAADLQKLADALDN